MLTQAMHSGDHVLKQLPHFSAELLERCKEKKVENVFDLLELEDDDRLEVLKMNDSELTEVARFCNNYPSVDIEHELTTKSPRAGKRKNLRDFSQHKFLGESIQLSVTLERDNDINGAAPPVIAPYYPQKRKDEGWWLVLGDPEANQLLAIKRLTVQVVSNEKFEK